MYVKQLQHLLLFCKLHGKAIHLHASGVKKKKKKNALPVSFAPSRKTAPIEPSTYTQKTVPPFCP